MCSLMDVHFPRRQRACEVTGEVNVFLVLGDLGRSWQIFLPHANTWLKGHVTANLSVFSFCSILKQGWLTLTVMLFFFWFLCRALVLDGHATDLLV